MILCLCRDRLAKDCPGEWEPGCDLGNNPKYCVATQEVSESMLDSIVEFIHKGYLRDYNVDSRTSLLLALKNHFGVKQ